MNQPTNEYDNDSNSQDQIPVPLGESVPALSQGNEAAQPDAAESQKEVKDIKGAIDYVRPCHGGRRFYFKDGSVAVLRDDGIIMFEYVAAPDHEARRDGMYRSLEEWKKLKRWMPKLD